MFRKLSVKSLKKKLDAIVSIYIRTKYSHNGLVGCFTCGRTLPISEMQNGHFQSRKHNNTRYLEINNHPQCYSCNCCNYGEQYEYGLMLDKTYGTGTAEYIKRQSRILHRFTTTELQELIEKYTNKTLQL